MFIDIHELERHPLDFQEEFPPDAIDLGADFRQRTSLKSEGHAQLIQEQHGKQKIIKDIRLRGGLSVSLEVSCARCLDPVFYDLDWKFDLLYRPQGADAGHEELSVTDAEAEVGYYQGDGVLLEDVLREQVLLAVPLKLLCREDCKGLCPHCGKRLNLEKCSCTDPLEDPRWSALKEIRNKLEQ
jgi:uncharacterized protein